MKQRISISNLQVDQELFNFIEHEVLPDSPISSDRFWQHFAALIDELSPQNRELLITRDLMQNQIDNWHKLHQIDLSDSVNFESYKTFLKDINYIVPEVDDFKISTINVDKELATIAGPQLVVPIMNARFALNAVNARWGSLYDALYGSDVIDSDDSAVKSNTYNPARGAKVIAFARDFLDQSVPLVSGSHKNAVAYLINDGRVNNGQVIDSQVSDSPFSNNQIIVTLEDGSQSGLINDAAFIGFTGNINTPEKLLFKHNGLHFEIVFDDTSNIAQSDLAGISDITIEAALTTIMDCEDSVAAVDAQDKVIGYRNWLGLNKGNLSETIEKNGKKFTRVMNPDRSYQTLNDEIVTIKGRSLMFVRNVGHLMTNGAIIDAHGNPVPEGIMDAMITTTANTNTTVQYMY